jgi:flavin-dependent dehydrogenase
LFERTSDVVREPVLLIGDAAGYVDAITGEGLSLAFAEALALGETVAPALQAAENLGRALRAYRRRQRAITRSYRFFTTLVLSAGRHPALVERLVVLLGRHPRLFQRLLSANMFVEKGEHDVRRLARSLGRDVVTGA